MNEYAYDVYLDLPAHDGAQLPISAVVGGPEDAGCCLYKPFHRHNFYEIVWLHTGSTRLICDFTEYRLMAGTLVFITPGQIHKWVSDGTENTPIVFSFKPDLFIKGGIDVGQTLANLPFYDSTAEPFIAIPDIKYHLMNTLFMGGLSVFRTEIGNRNELLSAYLKLIFAEAKTVRQADSNHPLPAPQQLLRQFRQAMYQHYLERLQVQDYAVMLGVTTSHLIETIRQTTGTTPGEMLHSHLLLEAKRLLVYSDCSVAEISEKLAFKTTPHFGQWFRKNEGIAPGEFRKQLLNP